MVEVRNFSNNYSKFENFILYNKEMYALNAYVLTLRFLECICQTKLCLCFGDK